MARNTFTLQSFLLRMLAAIVLVFATYNPEGYSYYHWGLAKLFAQPPEFSVLKGFVGVVLLIGWAIFLRATFNSLGVIGTMLAIAFFGTLVWFATDRGLIPADSVRAISYIVLIMISGVMAAGVSWSHIRRRITGQLDVDDND
ncbi:MAG: DUF6524 family protein [Acidiferrobacterales bacterium]